MMKKQSRMASSITNIVTGLGFRAFSILSAFVVRTVFICTLSNDYLSVNGLFTSILSMLSLAELGFGTAMTYSMYKPLAEHNIEKLRQLMQLYKRVYRIIGAVVLVVGLSLIPFFDVLIKDKPDIPGLTYYYILFILDTVLSYWVFAYRTSIFHADQRTSVISLFSIIFNFIKSTAQIVVLVLFRNYTLFIVVQIVSTILQNIVLSLKAEKEYPIFSNRDCESLPKEEREHIFKDVKALMIQKISFKVLNTSDSLLISSFVGVGWVGLLSNYLLIEEAVVAVLTQFISAITASMGNFFAKKGNDEGYILFRRVDFINYWIYSFSATALIVLLTPFIHLWIGNKYELSFLIVIALVIRFFVEGYMNAMSAFRSTLGLFQQGKYLPLLVAGLNIFFSVVLSFRLGVAGILFATPLARCCINVWYMPWVIHRDGFKRSVKPFYYSYFVRITVLCGIVGVMVGVSRVFFSNGVTITNFILVTILTGIIPNLILIVVFRKTDEFQYFANLIVKTLRKKNRTMRNNRCKSDTE